MSRHGYTVELRAEPSDARLSELLSGIEGVKSVRQEEDLWILDTESDITGEIVRKLVQCDYCVTHIRQRSGDLDEIYVQYFKEAGENDAVSPDGGRSSGGKDGRKKK